MIVIMFILTLVIAFAAFMALVWAIQEKKLGYWVGFIFSLACLGVAVWITANTYLGVAVLASLS